MPKKRQKSLEFRASQVGKCPVLLALEKMNADMEPVPLIVQRIMEEGSKREDDVVAWLETKIDSVDSRQQETLWPLGSYTITGHIDGVALVTSDDQLEDSEGEPILPGSYLLEIKVLGEQRRQILREKGLAGFPQYRMQLASYWAGLNQGDPDSGLECLEPGLLPGALYVVQEWSNPDRIEVRQFSREYMDKMVFCVADELMSRLAEVEYMLRGDGWDEKYQDPGPLGCGDCPARYQCFPELRPEKVPSGDNLFNTLEEYRQAHAVEKAAASQKKACQALFQTVMEERGTAKLLLADESVSLSEQTRTNLSYAKLPADLQRMVTPYVTESNFTQVRVNLRKGGLS